MFPDSFDEWLAPLSLFLTWRGAFLAETSKKRKQKGKQKKKTVEAREGE